MRLLKGTIYSGLWLRIYGEISSTYDIINTGKFDKISDHYGGKELKYNLQEILSKRNNM